MARSGQLIIGLLNGVEDYVIKSHVNGLQLKADGKSVPSRYVFITLGTLYEKGSGAAEEEIFNQFDEINDVHDLVKKGDARLYIHGHGNWVSQTVAGFTPKLTYILVQSLIEATRAFSLVSITACEAGRDQGSSESNRVMESTCSFGWKFAEALYANEQNRKIDVYARTHEVSVDRMGTTVGQKRTTTYSFLPDVPEIPIAHVVNKRARSKMRITYKDGKQCRFWVDYDNKANPDAWPAID